MAEYLASIFGTEKDKHGEQCSRLHNKPTFSQNVANMTEVQAQEIFDEFFEEVFVECESKYGEIEEMNVCDNLGDHLYKFYKFRREEDAEKAVKMLNQRWFGGRPVHAELSPVTDFREACCRQYELGECTRGGFCNFMHLKPISRELCRKLYNRSKRRYGGGSRRRRSRSRSGGHRRSRSPKGRGSRR
ncbi:Splicing factor U2AF 35 kDa subunit [Taenia crassiceps]|uniref:Splicing factor U2AF 35 kDa subunit n=1 Tax=Taenia crassiceps TaxID=6207 RepID=A0ABR4QA41_9CEST